MNWKHVKNIFLLLLLFVNLLLGSFVYGDYRETAFTDSETAARAAALLRADGLRVSEALLAVQNDEAASYHAPYDREEYLMAAATFLLGEAPDSVYLLPHGIRAETEGGAFALLKNDLSVAFGTPFAAERTLSYTEEEGEAATVAFASLLRLTENELSDAGLQKTEDGWLLTLTQTIGGIPLADATCTFGMTDGKLVYAVGRHFFGAPDAREEAPLLNRVNILLKERERGARGSVVKISLCYALYENTERGLLSFIPAYRLQFANGEAHVVNAISGDIVQPLA